jgi:ammonium transporter, Amt family
MMQSGFAMLCAGSVRQKNVKNIMLKNLLDACGGALGFWSIGFALAYGDKYSDDNSVRFIGNDGFFLTKFTDGDQYIGWFFQFAFAATAATIVAGTVAERCKMAAYLCYSVFLTGFVYPVIVHSIWASDGFLSAFHSPAFRGIGVIDFAGSGVVHLTGGCTALVAAIILGPRKGRFYDDDGNVLDTPVSFQPHSVALQILGTFILWFGWYGFNPGSALAIANSGSAAVAGLCTVTTTIGAAAGGVTAMFLDTIIDGLSTGEASYDLSMAMNGLLGGLVAITAGCSVITPWAALIIGMVGGVVYYVGSKTLIALKIDDAVDAVPVHFGNGMWGLIAVGLFAEPDRQALAYSGNITHVGWFYNFSDANLLLVQFTGLCWVIGWVTAVMTPFFIMLNMLGMFRVDALEEEVGLDISHHRGSAYDMTGPSGDHVEKLMEVRASRHGKVEVPKETAAPVAIVVDEEAEETA